MMLHSNLVFSKTLRLAALAVALVVLIFTAAACSPAPTAAPAVAGPESTAAAPAAWQEIDVAQAAARRDAGAFMLDVRTDEEWNEIHIPGATHIPLDELENRLSEVPQDQEIVVYCRSGNRSKPGAETLINAGYTNVSSMAGGVKEWKAAGYPTVTGP